MVSVILVENVILLLGIISFLVGFWYLSAGKALKDEFPQNTKGKSFRVGGGIGITIGAILIIFNVFSIWWLNQGVNSITASNTWLGNYIEF